MGPPGLEKLVGYLCQPGSPAWLLVRAAAPLIFLMKWMMFMMLLAILVDLNA